MIRSVVYICLFALVIVLGLSFTDDLPDPTRGPVPESQKVAHSSHCSGCHGVDETGFALVDYAGHDVSIFDDWQISMMGLSARDPFWRATMAHEVIQYPQAKEEIETTCLKCHSPLGSYEARRNGLPYSYDIMITDSLGLDGVSCSACHQQPAEGLGQAFSGNYTIDTNRLMFGHYPNPFKGPMQIYVGFEPEFSDHIYTSGVCAACHTLITGTLHDDGTPSGNFFVEQATYHEWLNSAYPAQGKECQACHIPFINDGVIVASGLLALEERQPFGVHQFSGANTAMLELMRANKELLQIPEPEGEHAWDESIQTNRNSLANAAVIRVPSYYVYGDTLYVTVSIKNKSGHKLPSGYPSRLAWLEVKLSDAVTQEALYTNGALDSEGHITGRDLPFEPHHEISYSGDDVQIYELVMSDLHGQLTTRLNAAYQPLKDNRLLPYGFERDHVSYDTVAVWGTAAFDPDYLDNSTAGADEIEYHIPLHGHTALADLQIALRYQTLPSRWMSDLFAHDDVPLVAQFKSMYQGYQTFNELIDTTMIFGIDLNTSAISVIESISAFNLYPNPTQTHLHIDLAEHFRAKSGLIYLITDLQGNVLHSDSYSEIVTLPTGLTPGIYQYALLEKGIVVAVKRFVVL